uniref:Uncharacterized protein n=1 Tax=Kalanchoe fedtschenkoi TaxID=63787 RepID=A0A7N0TIC4_KALFE
MKGLTVSAAAAAPFSSSSQWSDRSPLNFSQASFPSLSTCHTFRLTTSLSTDVDWPRSILSSDDSTAHTHRASSISAPVHETGWLYPLLQDIGINDKETALLLEKHPALNFTPFQSVKLRIMSLRSIGVDGLALSRLIMKLPDLLTADEVDSLVTFVANNLMGEIQSTQLEKLLASTEPRFLAGFDRKVKLLLHHGVPREKLAYVLNTVSLSKALCLRSYEEIDSTFTYLKPYGGADIIVKCPLILNYEFGTQLLPRINFWKDLSGGDVDATGAMFRKLPAILKYSLDHGQDHVRCLRSTAGLTDSEIFKLFLIYPNTISASRERKLVPRIEFLQECGLDTNGIFKFLTRAPLFLGLADVNVLCKLTVLVKLGYKYRTKEFAMAMASATRTSCDNLQKVIGLFLSYGLLYEEILVMSKKHPQILQYSYSSLDKKLEYLIEDMGREVRELLSFPAFLGYKLDDRIKSRYEEKKETRGEGMSINKLLTVSAESFSGRSVRGGKV